MWHWGQNELLQAESDVLVHLQFRINRPTAIDILLQLIFLGQKKTDLTGEEDLTYYGLSKSEAERLLLGSLKKSLKMNADVETSLFFD